MPTTKSRRLTIVLYFAAVFLFWAAMYFYVPTLPLYAQTKTDNLVLVGTVVAQYGLWQFILRIPLGIASDWLGRRKPFIIGGFVLAGLGAWVMGSAGGIEGIIVGRAITGLAAATWVPLIVVFSSLFTPEEAVRATSLLTIANSVGRMLATSTNGSLNNLGGYSLAFSIATLTAGLAILVVLGAHEKTRPSQKPSLVNLARLAMRGDVLVPSLLNAVIQFGVWSATFGFFPILAKQLGASQVLQSLMISMNIGVVLLGNLVVTTIIKKIGIKPMIYISFVMLALGLLTASLARSLPWIIVAQLITGFSEGIGYPVLMGLSIQKVDDSGRSTAMGIHQSVYAIGMFAGPWLSGILANAIGIQPMLGAVAAFCLIMGWLGTFTFERHQAR
jgi:MFS family permease